MKLCSAQLLWIWAFFVVLSLLPLACADLDSDRQALLSFAANVPHGPKLEWSNATPICTSWFGVTCNSNFTRVLTLRLPVSGLTGPIPSNTLGELDALTYLSLRKNHLNGTLPSDLLSLRSLRWLYLQHNNFTGNVPAFFPRQLQILDLSFNSFTGNISATIRYSKHLTGLYIQRNSISGSIPNVTFSKLKHINVSYNNLSGSIPSSFKTFPYSSFTGNSFLCGLPLKSCRAAPIAVYIVVGYIVVVVGSLLGLMFVVAHYKEKNPSLIFFEGCPFNVDLDDLLRAPCWVLGRGSLGITVALRKDSMTVAVKRLQQVAVARKEFEKQMEIIGRVGQHPNVVPLRGYYYSTPMKLLVYDLFERGSLMSLLHGNNGIGRNPLDWKTRMKIALGTAKGLAHIHSIRNPTLCHGNIKASNVLVNHEMDGCISDIGLHLLMKTPLSSSHADGYRAPEVVETQQYSHKSDVYSFGVLFLEMLTGKQPVQYPERDDDMTEDLPGWVQWMVIEKCSSKVYDVELMGFPDTAEEMVNAMEIGLECVVRVPDNRPTMDEVVRKIEQTCPGTCTIQRSLSID